jgi:hypothetical protein
MRLLKECLRIAPGGTIGLIALSILDVWVMVT